MKNSYCEVYWKTYSSITACTVTSALTGYTWCCIDNSLQYWADYISWSDNRCSTHWFHIIMVIMLNLNWSSFNVITVSFFTIPTDYYFCMVVCFQLPINSKRGALTPQHVNRFRICSRKGTMSLDHRIWNHLHGQWLFLILKWLADAKKYKHGMLLAFILPGHYMLIIEQYGGYQHVHHEVVIHWYLITCAV